MTTYTATVRHHSISRHYTISVGGTLTDAKRAATREFGAGYLDHAIVICLDGTCVAHRRICDHKWTNVAG